MIRSLCLVAAALAATAGGCATGTDAELRARGFVPLFNGRDLDGWRTDENVLRIWKVLDGGLLDCTPSLALPPGKRGLPRESMNRYNLITRREYGDFVLRADWRWKGANGTKPAIVLGPDGRYVDDPRLQVPACDSGIYLRATIYTHVNIWPMPGGSGELGHAYGSLPETTSDVLRSLAARRKADLPFGEWNTFEITLRGNVVTVVLNGDTVADRVPLPRCPPKGPIALQEFGSGEGAYSAPPSLIQFRRLYIKELR